MRSLMLLLLCCSWVMPVSATECPVLMAYGDSLTEGDVLDLTNRWPVKLQALRPDLTVVNEGKGGDPSDDLERFLVALEKHHPDVVTIMLGTNDAVCQPDVDAHCDPENATPARSVKNLRTMALAARRMGADVYVLTQTPAAWIFDALCAQHPDAGGCPHADEIKAQLAIRQTFTREIAHALLRWRTARLGRRGIHVLDLRDEFAGTDWSALSTGVHLKHAGNDRIAAFLAAALP